MTDLFDPSAFLSTCSGRPGVYRMFDSDARLLYVGKAKNLKKRLASYFRKTGLAPKTAALVGRIAQVETTITANETEALLLEQTLIKEWRPPYNILLRDDKSYPYVLLSDGDFPRLSIHRGAKKLKGRYFGPYPSAGAIRESLNLLQKTFLVRQCEDSFYKNRTRPCLQYQIKRCKGPCVGLVEPTEYAEDVRHSVMFLEGRSNALTDELSSGMQAAAMSLDFERAAALRDQISLLRRVQDQQSMEGGTGDVDVVAAMVNPGGACVHLISVRGGRVLGSKNFFPQVAIEEEGSDVLLAFLAQYYLSSQERDLPSELIVNAQHDDFPTLIAAIDESRGRELSISYRVRGTRARWQQLAVTNAEQALAARLYLQHCMQQAQFFQARRLVAVVPWIGELRLQLHVAEQLGAINAHIGIRESHLRVQQLRWPAAQLLDEADGAAALADDQQLARADAADAVAVNGIESQRPAAIAARR